MDLKRIESLIEVVKDSTVSELSVRQDGTSVVVKKPAVSPSKPKKVAKPKPVADDAKTDPPIGETVIHAPMVGIFHVIGGIGEGVEVRRGQSIGAIESMKLMNEIKSQADGTIAEAYVEDGMPVEFGQALFRLKKA